MLRHVFHAFDFLYRNLATIIYWLLFVTFGILNTFAGQWVNQWKGHSMASVCCPAVD